MTVYRLIAENEKGERLELTNNRNYNVLDVAGTNPPVARINTSELAGLDGSKLNSSNINQRNIVITLAIQPPFEDNRLALYKFFRVKRRVRIFYQNKRRNVYIDGYVESFENNPWTQQQQPQISIICPQPFWMSVAQTRFDFSNSIAMFEFPFSIPSEGIEFSQLEQIDNATVNAGEVETGGIIEFIALESGVKNPKFYNRTTGQFFGVSITMQQGDVITINTQTGEKSATLLRDSNVTNIISDMTAGSSWVHFDAGENEIDYSADEHDTDLIVRLSLVQKFDGV